MYLACFVFNCSQGYKHTRTYDGEVTTTSSGDGKRMQADVKAREFAGVTAALRTALGTLFPGRTMESVVSLRSLPGSDPQPMHLDYTYSHQTRRDAAMRMRAGVEMPILAFIALQDNTTLRVWPKSYAAVHAAWRGQPIPPLPHGGKMQIARLGEGDLLLFRPDLVHAGDAYDCENYRLHAFCVSQVRPAVPHAVSRELPTSAQFR